MNNEKFKQKMAKLEQERDAYIARLTPEEQQAFKQKPTAFNEQDNMSDTSFSLNSGIDKSAKNK